MGRSSAIGGVPLPRDTTFEVILHHLSLPEYLEEQYGNPDLELS